MDITFFGATEGVTGSKTLLEANGKKILIDCGLYQGSEDHEKNWDKFPFEVSSLDAVIITHSHIDHIGTLPKLCKDGYNGKIYVTAPTKEFSSIFLADCMNLVKEESRELFTQADIDKCVSLMETVDYHAKREIFPGVTMTFYDAGHILGSAFILIESEGKRLVFSGDLGNPPVPIIKDTDFIKDVDYVVLESTYGNRIHEPSTDRIKDLEKIIEDAYTKKGVLLIPAFALERTQELLYEINELITQNRVPQIPVYIDSPLAIKATNIYPKFIEYFDEEARTKISQNKELFEFKGLKMIESSEESKMLDKDESPKIIMAGSGMSNGGRILFHEKVFLPNPNTTLLIIGFQVKGTLGRRLQDGEKNVRILSNDVSVNANIVSLNSYSAHADKPKLIYWLREMNHRNIKKVFLMHGEEDSKKELQSAIKDELGVETIIPKYNQKEII